jgi:hypothetical protein
VVVVDEVRFVFDPGPESGAEDDDVMVFRGGTVSFYILATLRHHKVTNLFLLTYFIYILLLLGAIFVYIFFNSF